MKFERTIGQKMESRNFFMNKLIGYNHVSSACQTTSWPANSITFIHYSKHQADKLINSTKKCLKIILQYRGALQIVDMSHGTTPVLNRFLIDELVAPQLLRRVLATIQLLRWHFLSFVAHWMWLRELPRLPISHIVIGWCTFKLYNYALILFRQIFSNNSTSLIKLSALPHVYVVICWQVHLLCNLYMEIFSL